LVDALTAARTIDQPFWRASILSTVTEANSPDATVRWDLDWREVLAIASIGSRQYLTQAISKLSGAIARFGSLTAVRWSHEAINDVARWWP
jgi:hypothetical protein